MNPTLFQQPFFQVTLPLMVTFVATVWAASWSQNKRFGDFKDAINQRFDEMSRRFDEVIARLVRIETKLENHDERLTRVEERISPIGRAR